MFPDKTLKTRDSEASSGLGALQCCPLQERDDGVDLQIRGLRARSPLYELRKRGRTLRVPQQPLRILVALVAAAGDLVTREELRDRVWDRGTHVDFDRAINKAVNRLRQLLGDDAVRPRFIETLSKRGYRFVAEVTRLFARREIRQETREAYLKARHFWNKRTWWTHQRNRLGGS